MLIVELKPEISRKALRHTNQPIERGVSERGKKRERKNMKSKRKEITSDEPKSSLNI